MFVHNTSMVEVLGAPIDLEEENFLREFQLDVVDQLGASLPANDQHSVSVSLPEWQHVVGYEEGDHKIINAMTAGYPRFRVHDNVVELQNRLIHILQCLFHDVDGKQCMVFPSIATAIRFHAFMVLE
jgi:cystathionine gamma-synthase